MKKILMISAFFVTAMSLSACSTVEGVGEDLSKASRAVESSM